MAAPPTTAADVDFPPTWVAMVGCGYAADLYQATWRNYPNLRLAGVWDHDPQRLRAFAAHHGVRAYRSLDDLLADDRVAIVVNVTSPASHHPVSKAALLAGKHVYTEKPMATNLDDALELASLAGDRGLQVSGAPCSVLGETAQTMWKAMRHGRVGPVRAAYAELDDGMVHRMAWSRWTSPSGAKWPALGEFETGCTMEHAGYYLTWLVTFFGPVRRMVAHASVAVPDKDRRLPPDRVAPDLTVGVLEHDSGVVSRLTCSVVGPRDHRLQLIGETGTVATRECWDYRAPVYVRRPVRGRTFPVPVRPARRARFATPWANGMDFARGVAELAQALHEGRPSRLSTELTVHVTEVTCALQYPERGPRPYEPRTAGAVKPIDPLPWAR